MEWTRLAHAEQENGQSVVLTPIIIILCNREFWTFSVSRGERGAEGGGSRGDFSLLVSSFMVGQGHANLWSKPPFIKVMMLYGLSLYITLTSSST